MRNSSYIKRSIIAAALTLLASSASAGDAELGQELYDEFCANCHGADKAGLRQFSDDADMFAERLEEGVTENMPDFAGVFEEDEIAALFAYLDEPEE